MRTAPVKAIVLPAVYRANLEFQSHVPFQHSRMCVMRVLSRSCPCECYVHACMLESIRMCV